MEGKPIESCGRDSSVKDEIQPSSTFFSNILEKEEGLLGLFSLSRRTISVLKKDNFKIGRSSLRPTYAQFKEINKLFNEYVPRITDPKAFMGHFYKLELAGAEIVVKNKSCLIVEERKNSLITITRDNKIRTHIKQGLRFTFETNNVKYLVIGDYLKLNRFTKK